MTFRCCTHLESAAPGILITTYTHLIVLQVKQLTTYIYHFEYS